VLTAAEQLQLQKQIEKQQELAEKNRRHRKEETIKKELVKKEVNKEDIEEMIFISNYKIFNGSLEH